jgi:hypothetical protein
MRVECGQEKMSFCNVIQQKPRAVNPQSANIPHGRNFKKLEVSQGCRLTLRDKHVLPASVRAFSIVRVC